MSCYYGPGRYDLDYEQKGIDYPAAYVRWTEKRNMQAFQELLHTGRINIDYLTTQEFSLADAPKAYDMIVNRSSLIRADEIFAVTRATFCVIESLQNRQAVSILA